MQHVWKGLNHWLWLGAGETEKSKPSSAEFERLKTLVGTWQGKTDIGQGLIDMTVQYRLLAGGTVLEERVFAGTPNEMLTIYFDRDGKLALTHYCIMGNRPGMLLKSSDSKTLKFEFDETCGINPAKESHMHALTLHCTFLGDGRVESHQRWSTGMLYDNCRVPGGGMDFRNRGSMGSGHGWTMGWGVAWNCEAKDFVIQNPPGAVNWMIGCVGESKPMPRPFGTQPNLPEGNKDSHGAHVKPQSLYLAQLAERLGPQALKNVEATA